MTVGDQLVPSNSADGSQVDQAYLEITRQDEMRTTLAKVNMFMGSYEIVEQAQSINK